MTAQSLTRADDPTQHHTRKDKATTFTRRMILDSAPDGEISRHYRNLDEVVITAQYLSSSERMYPAGDSNMRRCLKRLFRNTSSDDFHVSLHVDNNFGQYDRYDIGRLFPTHRLSSRGKRSATKYPIVHTYQCIDIPEKASSIFHEARCSRSVVNLLGIGASDRDRARLVEAIGSALSIRQHSDTSEDKGRLRLCGVPRLMLSPAQLANAADNAAEIAKHHLLDAVRDRDELLGLDPIDLLFSSQELESLIELVEPGFKPPSTENRTMLEKRSVLCSSSNTSITDNIIGPSAMWMEMPARIPDVVTIRMTSTRGTGIEMTTMMTNPTSTIRTRL